MYNWIWTPKGDLRVRRAYVAIVQAEIDELLREHPDAKPIDALTLIGLEAQGETWNFETGQVEAQDGMCN